MLPSNESLMKSYKMEQVLLKYDAANLSGVLCWPTNILLSGSTEDIITSPRGMRNITVVLQALLACCS